jgi:drug/metabolite transporter (DMT)-like permease
VKSSVPIRTSLDEAARRRALMLLALSAVCFGLMAFAARLAAQRLGGPQIAAVRFLVMLVPVLVVPAWWRRATDVRRLDLLFHRGVFGGSAVLLYFFAIEHLGAGLATLLNYTSPLWSVLFAAWFLGEPVRRVLVVPLIVTLSGVALVTRGALAVLPGDSERLGLWTVLGVVSAVLSGAAVTAIRAARRTETSWSIYASLSVFGLLATAPFAIPDWKAPTPAEWCMLLAVGITSVGAQLSMTYAYRWATNLEAGVLAQLAVVLAMALGVLFMGEPFGVATALGTALTMGGVVLVIWLQRPPRAVE